MEILPLSGLNTILDLCINNAGSIHPKVYYKFMLMRQYGLRFSECSLDRINFTNSDSAIITLSKGSGTRIISDSALLSEIYILVNDLYPSLLSLSYSMCQRYFNRCIQPYNISLPGKSLDLHAFRHYIIKTMIAEGMSKPEVIAIMKITNSTFDKYSTSIIYTNLLP